MRRRPLVPCCTLRFTMRHRSAGRTDCCRCSSAGGRRTTESRRMAAWISGSVISGSSIEPLDRAAPPDCARPSRIPPGPAPGSDGAGRSMPNSSQAFESAVDGLGDSPPSRHAADLEMRGRRLVDPRCAARQQLRDQSLGLSRSPVRNSHSASSSRRANINSYWRSSRFRPAAPCRPQYRRRPRHRPSTPWPSRPAPVRSSRPAPDPSLRPAGARRD